MFIFLFTICDRNGNSPLFGDNDSGTLLQFKYEKNQDYSYMRAFYRRLFSHQDHKNHEVEFQTFEYLMPAEGELYEVQTEATGLEHSENRLFKDSGIMSFRRGKLSGNIFFIPIGQNGLGGHNHLDAGSFVLSYEGHPILVDPGTYTYTRDFKLRNRFREYSYHNTVIPDTISDRDFNTEKLFELDVYCKMHRYTFEKEENFTVSYSLLDHPHTINREFQFSENTLRVSDTSQGPFTAYLYFAPGIRLEEHQPGQIRTRLFMLTFNPEWKYLIGQFEYANRYNTREVSQCLSIKMESTGTMSIVFIDEK